MNQRIRAFEKESGLEIYGLGKDRVKWEAVMEQFAELIVQECIDYCGENLSKTVGGALKIHFGVEE